MKKLLSFVVALVVVITMISIPAYAHENTNIVVNGNGSEAELQVSEAMSFSEMVACYAESTGATCQEALTVFPKEQRASHGTYRVLSVTLNVTSQYNPYIEFYCNTEEYGHYWAIKNIYSTQLVRSDGNMSKQFSGTLEVWLRSAYEIEFSINGDFYNNGTTSCTNGGEGGIGLGGYFNISYAASQTMSTNHYKYYYDHRTVAFQQ